MNSPSPGPAQAHYSLIGKRVYIAGHRGLVGQACVRRLAHEGCELVTIDRERLDLRDQAAVARWMGAERPDVVILAAATVGGIAANASYPADFLFDNLMIEANVIHAARGADVEKLLFLGSSCIYPRDTAQPVQEDALLSGPLEPTNAWYAVAKIAGVKLCQAYRRQYGCDFICAMPANLFGPGDTFNVNRGHVIPAMMRRFHEAKLTGAATTTCWGTGTPRREFLFVDDLADACVFLLQRYSEEQHINVGTGVDMTIGDLARAIAGVVGYTGDIAWDPTRPDGTPAKCMDVSRLTSAGWQSTTPFAEGLAMTYNWMVGEYAAGYLRQSP